MYTAGDLINFLGERQFKGNLETVIERLNLCNRKTAYSSILSYATKAGYEENIAKNVSVKALIVPLDLHCYDDLVLTRNGIIIYSKNPEKDFYFIHEELCRAEDFYKSNITTTKIGKACSIHPTAVIEDCVEIGDNVTIGAHTVIKKNSIIGDNTIIGCNTVIGSEGFQVIRIKDEAPMHITHIGGVKIGNNVYIGDCVCIGNCLFEGFSVIEDGVKIDNLSYIAHNIHIGENAVITAQVAVCGSATIEPNAWVAPNTAVLNNVVIGKGAMTGLGSVVVKNIPDGMLAYGTPASPKRKL